MHASADGGNSRRNQLSSTDDGQSIWILVDVGIKGILLGTGHRSNQQFQLSTFSSQHSLLS